MKRNEYHILCPLDGSDRTQEIFDAILPLVRAGTSRVTTLEVLTGSGDPLGARPHAARALESLRARHIPVEGESRRGIPAEQILAFSRELKVDLIAMMTRARNGLSRMLHPSVTEDVLRHGDVPLLICRSGQILRDWSRILVLLDDSVSGPELLSDVSFLAQRTGASVELLQAMLPGPISASGTGGLWMQAYGSGRDALTSCLKQASELLASTGVDVRPVRRWFLSSADILQRLNVGDIDLVCMTTRDRTNLSRFFMGCMEEDIMRHAPCPVFIRRVSSRDSEGLGQLATKRVESGQKRPLLD